MKKISHKQTILIVEDSNEDFEATKRAFEKSNLKNPIHRCTEGEEALDYLYQRGKYDDLQHHPGMILLDLNIPGTDGREVLEIVKSDPQLKKIPIAVFTTSNDETDIEFCYQSGANSYIQKPVSIDGLFQSIARLKDYWFEVVILPKDD